MIISIQIVLQLIYATLLGSFIGIEREYKRKDAGFQTYALVCLGACLFTILFYSLYNSFNSGNALSFDPGRIIQAIAIGIGFLGAGVIFKQDKEVSGLTTAAGLWVAAGIGVAVAIEEYVMALITSLLVILVFTVWGVVERKMIIKKK